MNAKLYIFVIIGKSHLISELISVSGESKYFKQPFTEILYCFPGQYVSKRDHEFIENLKQKNSKIRILTKVVDSSSLVKSFKIDSHATLVILDDFESEHDLFNDRFLANCFSMHSSHHQLSFIIVLQTAQRTSKDRFYNVLFRNANYIFCFPSIDR